MAIIREADHQGIIIIQQILSKAWIENTILSNKVAENVQNVNQLQMFYIP